MQKDQMEKPIHLLILSNKEIDQLVDALDKRKSNIQNYQVTYLMDESMKKMFQEESNSNTELRRKLRKFQKS